MSVTTSVHDFITDYLKKDAVSFHMPGHKGSHLYRRFGYHDFLDRVMDYDITEIAGADNLFQTEGIIKGVQEHYARLYDCKKSYILINGSSGGNIAAILASVRRGKQLIMARNCHKSVFNALTLGGIRPVYAYPEMIEEFGISGAVSPAEIERLIKKNPDAEAVLITSPNYYGICSDIMAIAETAHRHGKTLIVDEAHGAHLHFSDELPLSAIQSGADLVISSTHKTLASFTQSAALHYNTDLVDHYLLEDKLQCIQSTSPSYILMTSMDIAADILERHRHELMKEWTGNLAEFYDKISGIPGVRTMGKMQGLDWTKINLSLGELGITGAQLDKILLNDYNIYIELFTGDWIMAMTGIGNTKEDYDRFADALEDVSRKARESGLEIHRTEHKAEPLIPPKQAELFDIPAVKKRVTLADSEGMICAASIIPYPPGIPLICPGERIETDAIAYIQAMRDMGEKVIGVNEAGEILVGK
ncbi:MAG TPA: aminotransferase class V-fold PLP-dependent enzyme [Anaerovoracaceae bacterium]|nr:aminotransferase class V-fold PLP-dependent enzyme [Anaerovoracaceae bacterium]